MIFNQFNAIRPALLERMPVAELKRIGMEATQMPGVSAPAAVAPVAAAPAPSSGGDLLDLLGDSTPSAAPAAAAAPSDGLADLLGLDLLGGPAPAAMGESHSLPRQEGFR